MVGVSTIYFLYLSHSSISHFVTLGDEIAWAAGMSSFDIPGTRKYFSLISAKDAQSEMDYNLSIV